MSLEEGRRGGRLGFDYPPVVELRLGGVPLWGYTLWRPGQLLGQRWVIVRRDVGVGGLEGLGDGPKMGRGIIVGYAVSEVGRPGEP